MKELISIFSIILISFLVCSGAIAQDFERDGISVHPISHATMVIKTDKVTIVVDPVGDQNAFSQFGTPNIILVTDIHRDHLNTDLIKVLQGPDTSIIVSQAVFDGLKEGKVLNNGDSTQVGDVQIEAIPAYNISPDRMNFHPKERGNGYLLTLNGKKVYVSGDTEDIQEMRDLKGIDIAFICMNLPYTMTVEQAASAVLDFKPQVAIPYHYRGQGGMSDIEKFKSLVNKGGKTDVVFLKWY